jgi:predicted lysophospholipase L1 biosynthesis ABC-type transport system permease subunit
MLTKLYPSLLALSIAGGSPIITFVIVAVLVAVALYYLPTLLPMDAQVWAIIRAVVVIALILYALRLFGVI